MEYYTSPVLVHPDKAIVEKEATRGHMMIIVNGHTVVLLKYPVQLYCSPLNICNKRFALSEATQKCQSSNVPSSFLIEIVHLKKDVTADQNP